MAGREGIGSMKMIKLIEIIQSKVDGRNVEQEGPNYPVWANVERKGSGFDFRSGQVNLEESLKFKTWFRFEYNPDSKYKVLYLGNRHQVKSIQRIDENRFNWLIIADAKHN